MHADHPEITGKWEPVDDSDNRLEVAETDRGNVVAIRDTYAQQEVIFATGKQLRNLAQAVEKGRMRNLIR
jgi:hypothetical protein